MNVVEKVLKANDTIAQENRRRMTVAGYLAINLMSAPGSGKTTLLEKTLPVLAPEYESVVLVGDLQTTRDAERLGDLAAEVTQINTGRGCHLEAQQVAEALNGLKLERGGFLFIENVGNMVCPAAFDLGEHLRVVLLSVPEGDDKVAKYPTLFQGADAILLTKVDLRGVLDFDMARVRDDLARINTRARLLEISSRSGDGMNQWFDWLREQHASRTAAGG
ncbi:MAG: hydrogenase nickel incorporation protein HypB [Phycisphaerae bacterium]|nr:hydrogenase nickel incorporation protein HypB [Phycisphaerae bacterium]